MTPYNAHDRLGPRLRIDNHSTALKRLEAQLGTSLKTGTSQLEKGWQTDMQALRAKLQKHREGTVSRCAFSCLIFTDVVRQDEGLTTVQRAEGAPHESTDALSHRTRHSDRWRLPCLSLVLKTARWLQAPHMMPVAIIIAFRLPLL